MKLGFVSDSLGDWSFDRMLDAAERLGVSGVEVNTGGWSAAPHLDLATLKDSAQARQRFLTAFADRGLEIISLNANGNPLHPAAPEQGDCLLDTIRLAGDLGVETVCTMSGLPAGRPGDSAPNWVVSPWPPEMQEILRFQWEDVLIPFWEGVVAAARMAGVRRIALELHGNQCVYNVPTLLTLREAVGPTVGANLDPSHLMWMGADPLAAAEALGEAVFHVHAKDTLINARAQALTSRLDSGAVSDVQDRAWSYVTLGKGHDATWWAQFCHRLRLAGYDGWLAVEQEDALMDPYEGLSQSVQFLSSVMPKQPI